MLDKLTFRELNDEFWLLLNDKQSLVCDRKKDDRVTELFSDYLLTRHLTRLKCKGIDLTTPRSFQELVRIAQTIDLEVVSIPEKNPEKIFIRFTG